MAEAIPDSAAAARRMRLAAPSAGSAVAAPALRILARQTALEVRLTLRRGESLLLTLVIPVALLLFASAAHIQGTDIGFLAPGILGLAILSTAFTGQAIATGYERSYGVLQRLGATPLTRPLLLTAKTAGVVVVLAVQAVVIAGTALARHWHPHPRPAALAVALLGTAAFSALGLLMAGTLRAEATLAAANAVYLLLLLLGGVVLPLGRLPHWVAAVSRDLPVSALTDGLRATLGGTGSVGRDVLVLAVWAAVAAVLAARLFRWR